MKKFAFLVFCLLFFVVGCSDYNTVSMTEKEYNQRLQTAITPSITAITTQQLVANKIADGDISQEEAEYSAKCAVQVLDNSIADIQSLSTKQYENKKEEALTLLQNAKKAIENYIYDLENVPDNSDDYETCFKKHGELLQGQVVTLTIWNYDGLPDSSIEETAYTSVTA